MKLVIKTLFSLRSMNLKKILILWIHTKLLNVNFDKIK